MNELSSGTQMIGMIVYFGFMILMVASLWKVFTKAGLPGWGALVPIYNTILMFELAKKPLWWILLLFVPVVNFVVLIMVVMAIAENFGKGTGFGLGLTFLGFIFFPILAFGDARYKATTSSPTPNRPVRAA